MRIPQIDIINNWVYIDGSKSQKKYLPSWYHCRDIFYNEQYIIKTPTKDNGGADQNLFERDIWKVVKKDKWSNQFFAPVISCHRNGKYLVQKRMFFTSHRRTELIRNLIEKLCKNYKIGDVDPDDNKNWGMIGKFQPIIFDYGSEESKWS